MDDFVMPLVLGLDVCSLTMSLVNIASPRGAETALADSVEEALRAVTHLDVERVDNSVVARTSDGHGRRAVVVGHLGTAPVDDAPLAFVEMGRLFGPGASDAKGPLAVLLKAAAAGGFGRDVTFVFDGDEQPSYEDELRSADFVLVAAPTGGAVVGDAVEHPSAHRLIELTEAEAVTDPGVVHGLAPAASVGTPAVAFGPGDPSIAGTPGEYVATAQLSHCEFVLRQWLH